MSNLKISGTNAYTYCNHYHFKVVIIIRNKKNENHKGNILYWIFYWVIQL